MIPKEPSLHQSPVRLVIIIALSVFVSEAFVMIIVSFLQPSSALFEVLFDSTFLVVLLSPTFYFLFRPLVLHITERKRAEEALRKAHDELENRVAERTAEVVRANEELRLEIAERKRAEKALRQRNRELALINRASQAFTSTLDLDQVLDTTLEEVRRLLDVSGYSIWLIDPVTDELVCWQATGSKSEIVRGWRLALGEGIAGWVAQNGESLIVPDTRADEHHFKDVDQQTGLELRSILGVPLQVKQDVIGVLEMVDTEVDRFTPAALRLVEPLAASAAIAIENARLYEQAQQEITERKQAEEALKASEERYRSLSDGVPVGLYRTTSDGQILDANPALMKMLGYPDPESLLAVNATDLYVDPEDRERWRAQIDLEGIVRGVEVQLRRHDGTTIWARHTARAIRNAAPPVIYYEGAVEDITERKQVQAALIEAEKLAIAGRLAASLAHEINNPLQTVIGCLGLAEETLAEGRDASRYLQVAREELRRTADIVAQLRDLHRPSRPEDKEPTDMNALLDQVLDLSRKQCQSHRIEVLRAMADLPVLPLVADQIKQVLLNLLLNAIEAMPQGGRLQVSTTYTSQPAGARIAFTDSGEGIAPDVLPHVFEPFYSTRPEGLGLGLFISRNIVKQHGGQIEVDSRVGEGTTFTVWLPGAPPASQSLRRAQDRPGGSRMVFPPGLGG